MAKEVVFYQESMDSVTTSLQDYLMYSYNPIGIANGFSTLREFLNLYLAHGYELKITPISQSATGETTDLLFTLVGDFSQLPPDEQKRREEIEDDFEFDE